MKETLEQACKRYYEENIDQSNIPREHYEWEIQELMSGFCAEFQAEKRYSEEDIIMVIERAIYLTKGWTPEGFSFYRDNNQIKEEIINLLKNK